jgi:hypothetical protein
VSARQISGEKLTYKNDRMFSPNSLSLIINLWLCLRYEPLCILLDDTMHIYFFYFSMNIMVGCVVTIVIVTSYITRIFLLDVLNMYINREYNCEVCCVSVDERCFN